MSEDDMILEHIRHHGYITPAEAFSLYGCAAMHSAAARLRKRGLDIPCKIKTGNGKRCGEYSLIAEPARIAA